MLLTKCTRAVGLPCPTHGLAHWRGPKDHNYWRHYSDEVFGDE